MTDPAKQNPGARPEASAVTGIDTVALMSGLEEAREKPHPVDAILESLDAGETRDAHRWLKFALHTPSQYTTTAIASALEAAGAEISRLDVERWRKRRGITKATEAPMRAQNREGE